MSIEMVGRIISGFQHDLSVEAPGWSERQFPSDLLQPRKTPVSLVVVKKKIEKIYFEFFGVEIM